MNLKPLKPRKSLNKAFLKLKPNRTEIEVFKANLIQLLDAINDEEYEEHLKNLIMHFLKRTYYDPTHFINTKGKTDLVIHNGNNAGSTVGVLIETKKPSNKIEMLTPGKINVKALHELVLYYMRERVTHKNLEIRHLIATNINEWFIFDAHVFEKHFANSKEFVKHFNEFEEGRLAGKSTDFFYKQVAEPYIESITEEIEFTYFDIREYEKLLRNDDKKDDNKLIALFKLLSPEHLLKLPFANDSNTLDKRFYAEMLHIIGLTETKEGGKKIIERGKEGQRNPGSLLENAIIELDSLDKISRLEKPGQFGSTTQERLFNVALELSITWMNRILFLKLLEAQLQTYHKGDKSYNFLNLEKIRDFDDLNGLFFKVLAKKFEDRDPEIDAAFKKVPYLNSSLFEPTDLEHTTLFISNLRDEKQLPLHSSTVLKDERGRKRTGTLSTLEYLFGFLSAYDFTSEGSEEIQEDNKTLINASVLGLIFEKINGYKDGSFFTPGFITMYMCRETIRKAVLQKFKEAKGWDCENFIHLYNKIDDTNEANEIVNSLKICDPAVGSGHFLVSALNEIIAIKNDLRILQDREGKRLKEYHVEVVNDELIVTDEEGIIFEYNPKSKESQRIQETLFHEKQTLIENCLFGVDINPNSVKICSLRLWIELLKNAYYKNETELETLPNIDINIKCGNSLVSRYPLNANLKTALKSNKWSIESYRIAISTYRNTSDKNVKREMERLILRIKQDFTSEIRNNDPIKTRLDKLANELYNRFTGNFLFDPEEPYGKKEKELEKKRKKAQEKLEQEITTLTRKIEEIKSNKIFENAFEWRFEFPEVLDDKGDFVGFDVVIGNPPYIRQEEIMELKPYLKSHYNLYTGTSDAYIFFIEKGFEVLKNQGVFTFIMPNKFMQSGYGQPARKFLLEQNLTEIVDFGDHQVFDEATTYPCILSATKASPSGLFKTSKISAGGFQLNFSNYINAVSTYISHNSLSDETWIVSTSEDQSLLHKVVLKGVKLGNYINEGAKRGVLTGLTEAFVIDDETKVRIIESDASSGSLIKPFLLGRDISPYGDAKNNNWLILLPKGYTNSQNLLTDNPYPTSVSLPSHELTGHKEAWQWFSDQYPGIASHLEKYRKKAEARTDQGDYWWELRACDYYDKFEKSKIIYQVFQVKPCFILDEKGMYCNNSMWFIPTGDNVLLGILNSKMGWWLISKYCTAIQNGYQLIWKYFSQIPIATRNENVRSQIHELVDQILTTKKVNAYVNTSNLESQIDQLVYQLYDLTEEEIEIVENSGK